MASTKQQLEFTAVVAHHEYEEIKVEITDYSQDGPIMTVEVDDGSKSRVRVTRKELEELVRVFDLYDRARAILAEVSK